MVGHKYLSSNSTFSMAQNDSYWALSQHTAVRPTERTRLCSRANRASCAEVYWAAAISVQHHLLGELAAQRHRHRHRGLHQIGMQVLVKRPADHPPATAVTHRAEWRDLVALMSDGDPLGR